MALGPGGGKSRSGSGISEKKFRDCFTTLVSRHDIQLNDTQQNCIKPNNPQKNVLLV
jgi:hypothetical protein